MTETERPETTRDEVERTGRTDEVAPQARTDEASFGTPGTPAEQVPPGLENDVA